MPNSNSYLVLYYAIRNALPTLSEYVAIKGQNMHWGNDDGYIPFIDGVTAAIIEGKVPEGYVLYSSGIPVPWNHHLQVGVIALLKRLEKHEGVFDALFKYKLGV